MYTQTEYYNKIENGNYHVVTDKASAFYGLLLPKGIEIIPISNRTKPLLSIVNKSGR